MIFNYHHFLTTTKNFFMYSRRDPFRINYERPSFVSCAIEAFVIGTMLPRAEASPGKEDICRANGKPFMNMPAGLDWKYWWYDYRTRESASEFTDCSYDTFLDVLHGSFPHLRKKTSTTQVKCDICEHWKTLIRKAVNDDVREHANSELKKHIKEQMDERLHYMSNQEKARHYPEKYLSIIADCRAKQPFPMYHTRTKKTCCIP